MSSSLSNLLASALALALVLLLAWFAIKGLSKMTSLKKRKGGMQLIDSLPITARERLIVVVYKQQELLLGVTSQGISLLSTSTEELSESARDTSKQG